MTRRVDYVTRALSVPAPDITLVDVPYPLERVAQLVALSRAVVLRTGSPRWAQPLDVITDDQLRFSSLMGVAVSSATLTNELRDNIGLYTPMARTIWVKRYYQQRSNFEYVTTLAHEVAHVLSPGVHGREWRGVCARLTPLWVIGLLPPVYEKYMLDSRLVVSRDVFSYRSPHWWAEPGADRELHRLTRAVDTSRNRWGEAARGIRAGRGLHDG